MTRFFRFIADTFFVDRYGHRAVVLETVAGVPGMVAGVIMHFKSLRSMKVGYGESIREMLAEAENELPYDHGQALAEGIKNAELMTLEGVGHEIPEELTEEITQKIIGHIKGA